MMTPHIIYFRQDLRLEDNPALFEAAKNNAPIIALYIYDTKNPGKWQIGDAQKWWLYHSLKALKEELGKFQIPLVLRKGDPKAILEEIIHLTGATAVFWNRCYEPFALERDAEIENALRKNKVEVQTFNGSLLIEPWEMASKSGSYYRVFTKFWDACLKLLDPYPPLAIPVLNSAIKKRPFSDNLEEWDLLPKHPNWADRFNEVWHPGERHAKEALTDFIETRLIDYHIQRDYPGKKGTSLISPHLHMGEISARFVWHKIKHLFKGNLLTQGAECFIKEIGWREFSHHLLFHFKELPEEPINPKFQAFAWNRDEEQLKKWQKGKTGFPIVDAGMRELWSHGWMHNRVRMITASFLTKDLLIPWQVGEEWFWDTLVDADLANNSASWQWVSGSGADAQPFFRIFNPVLQGEKFDPDGVYIRKWVPELSKLPQRYIHKPWEAPVPILTEAGIILGKNYPAPIVDRKKTREDALKRFRDIK